MTYRLCKRIIDRGNYDKDDMMKKLNVFLLNNQLTDEEYQELVNIINAQ